MNVLLAVDDSQSSEAAVAELAAQPWLDETTIEASEWPADPIVMGSRGHGALKRLVLGSVAHHVLNHAPCSIHIMRSSDAA